MNTLEQKSSVLVFEKQRRESSKAFTAFQVYLELGLNRSHALVAQKIGVSKRMVHKWGSKYGWAERLVARDVYLAEVQRQAIERVAVENAVDWWKLQEPTRRQAWEEAEKAIGMVREARERWEESGRTPGFEGMARMLELAFKLKQFATGMPSEIKETHTHVTGKVSVEWEAAIRKAYGVVEGARIEDRRAESAVVEVEEVVPSEKQKNENRNLKSSESLLTSAATEVKV